jgi:hypothetical protein
MKNQNNKNQTPVYAPNIRDFFDEDIKKVDKASSKSSTTHLTNHIEDPIVVNNIANAEFNYTYNDESDL